MGRRRKQQPQREAAEPTGTVQARRKLERARQKAADQLRALNAEETQAAQKATAKRLNDKPEDTRTLGEPDPTGHLAERTPSVAARFEHSTELFTAVG